MGCNCVCVLNKPRWLTRLVIWVSTPFEARTAGSILVEVGSFFEAREEISDALFVGWEAEL